MAYPVAGSDTLSATAFIGNADADVFIPEIWTKEVVRARQAKLLFLGLVNRRFEKDLMAYGDKVNIPAVSHLQSSTKSTETAINYEALTETNTTLTVDQWKYSAIAQERITKRQAIHDMLEIYAPEQGYALALAIDDNLAGLPDDFSQTVGTLAVGLQYTDVLRAMQYLNDADVPQSDRQIVVSPAELNNLMNMDQFVHGDYTALNSDVSLALKEGYAGKWLNTPVYFSTNVEGSNAVGHDNTIFHKEALACVVQMEPTTHMFFDIDYFADKVAVEELYGTLEIRDDHGVFMKGA